MTFVHGAWLRSIRPVTEIESHGRAGFSRAYASNTLFAVDAARHILAGWGSDRVGCFWDDVTHTNALAIALWGLVNEEVGEGGVSAGSVDSGSRKQQSPGFPELHGASSDVFESAFDLVRGGGSINELERL